MRSRSAHTRRRSGRARPDGRTRGSPRAGVRARPARPRARRGRARRSGRARALVSRAAPRPETMLRDRELGGGGERQPILRRRRPPQRLGASGRATRRRPSPARAAGSRGRAERESEHRHRTRLAARAAARPGGSSPRRTPRRGAARSCSATARGLGRQASSAPGEDDDQRAQRVRRARMQRDVSRALFARDARSVRTTPKAAGRLRRTGNPCAVRLAGETAASRRLARSARYGNEARKARSFLETQSVLTVPSVIRFSSASITSSASRRPFRKPSDFAVSKVRMSGRRTSARPSIFIASSALLSPAPSLSENRMRSVSTTSARKRALSFFGWAPLNVFFARRLVLLERVATGRTPCSRPAGPCGRSASGRRWSPPDADLAGAAAEHRRGQLDAMAETFFPAKKSVLAFVQPRNDLPLSLERMLMNPSRSKKNGSSRSPA